MSFSAYSAYRESGDALLGLVPDHWRVLALKLVATVMPSNVDKKSAVDEPAIALCNYTDVYYNDAITSRLAFMEATATHEQIERFTLKSGDVLLTKDSETADDIAVSAFVPDDLPGVVCGYHLALARPNRDLDGRFLKRYLDSSTARAYFATRANGLTRVGLSQHVLNSLPVALPTIEEQREIAGFLDRETGRIDALVAEQERLIALLKEKRQALISHAVTKGLDLNAPMKDSGVEWLGPVPAHWSVSTLKRLSPAITVGIVVNPTDYVSEQGLPYIYGGDISEGRIHFEGARRISGDHSRQNAKTMLNAGDIVTVRVGAPGVSSVVPSDCEGGNCASVALIRKGAFDSRWLCYAMNSRVVRFQIECVQYGAAQEQFNIGHLVNFWLPVPGRSEQSRLADCIDEHLRAIDELLGEVDVGLTLLRERRSALISAAVTGKIDVRGLA